MSFSFEIKKEIAEQKIKKGCCRHFFLIGLLADAEIFGETLKFKTTSEYVKELILSHTHAETEVKESSNLGSPVFYIEIKSAQLAEQLSQLESGNADFHCTSCVKHLLSGTFISCGTVSEPTSGYHLEFKFKNIDRAKQIYKHLCDEGIASKIVNRKTSVGLYYKNSGRIEEILTYLGAVTTLFDFMNVRIEKDMRNTINRSTNCIAGNISKSVNAARKQVSTITALGEEGFLLSLPDELFETARLRLEYPTATLSELALVHVPPISKSGLTHRLAKIMDYALEKGVITEK